MRNVGQYLSAIGRRGGLKSRRTLDPATARDMVRVREARRAFRRFRTSCFWSCRADLEITLADVAWVAEQLMKHGNREAWRVGAKLCPKSSNDIPASTAQIDWAHDSAWRFMPLVRDPLGGLLLHPVDVAVNKMLALAGRDEPRDFVDILFIHRSVLPIGALVWAAVGKDPGFTPLSLLEMLKRRGRYHPEDFTRLALTEPFDLVASKQMWLTALAEADTFIRSRPPDEVGCLYYSPATEGFIMPSEADASAVPHYGRPSGVLPLVVEAKGS